MKSGKETLFWQILKARKGWETCLRLAGALKKARIAHGENEFWYDLQHIFAVPLESEILSELGFTKTTAEENLAVYERGPFSIRFVREHNDSFSLLHYRDETRHVHNMDYLHQLQHHYRAMTNFELSWP
jgi:hypothetical protein